MPICHYFELRVPPMMIRDVFFKYRHNKKITISSYKDKTYFNLKQARSYPYPCDFFPLNLDHLWTFIQFGSQGDTGPFYWILLVKQNLITTIFKQYFDSILLQILNQFFKILIYIMHETRCIITVAYKDGDNLILFVKLNIFFHL